MDIQEIEDWIRTNYVSLPINLTEWAESLKEYAQSLTVRVGAVTDVPTDEEILTWAGFVKPIDGIDQITQVKLLVMGAKWLRSKLSASEKGGV